MSQVLFTLKTRNDNDIFYGRYFDVRGRMDIDRITSELTKEFEATMVEPIEVEVGRSFYEVVAEAMLNKKYDYISKEIIEYVIEIYNLEQKIEVTPKDIMGYLGCAAEVTPVYGLIGPDDHEDIVALMVDYH